MSILSLPVAADTLARVFAGAVNPAPKAAVRFAEIPGRTSQATIPTRYGPVAATIYHPPSTWNARRCTSTSTAADSSSGTLTRRPMVPVLGRERRCRGEPRLRAGTEPALSRCAPTDLRASCAGPPIRTGTGTAPGCVSAVRARAATSAPRLRDWRWSTAHRASRCRCCTTRRSTWPSYA